ncbi:MAG: SDR family oxidoreductase [Deltaproteobacteria bacterium]|nr:SDR family oxidoreductase [Deltaproteobacteria bacterium]
MANVLITGCSSGFGFETALVFARHGDRVFATMRDPACGAALQRAASDEGLGLEVLRLDVADRASVEGAVRTATAAGPLEVLVNNAGIELRSAIEDASEDDVRRQFDTNLYGPLRTIRAVLPGMRERRCGTIVNVSSIAGIVARPYGGLYAASKHALEAVSEALHFEVQPFGVRVVLVEPGQYGTRLLDNALFGESFAPGSPYWERATRFEAAIKKLRPGGVAGGAHEVAGLIYHAVHDPHPKLRYLAGGDAETIAATYRSLAFEEYERTMRRALDWFD